METARSNRPPFTWRVIAALFVVALALYLRPYTGIRHDAILYLGQGLAERYPDIYGNDLFFAYGSQAEFTVFPPLIAWLLGLASPSTVFLWGTLFGRLFFIGCCWVFVRSTFNRGIRLPALIAVIVLPSGYGAFNIFRYGEVFLTARPFAEGLVLLGLASLIRRRLWPALASIIASGFLHPLAALTGMIVGWLWLVMQDRRWLRSLWILLPVAAAAVLGVAPADRLLLRFDPQWTSIMVDLNDHCFPSMWPLRDWVYWGTDLYLIHRLARRGSLPLSRLAAVTAIAMIVTVCATIVLGELAGFAFVTGLQAWRVHWIGHLLAMAALPVLLVDEFQHGKDDRTRVLLLVAIALVGAPLGYGNQPWANAMLIPLHATWPWLRDHIGRRYGTTLRVGLCLVMAVHAARYFATQWKGFAASEYRADLFRIDVLATGYPLVVGLLAWGGLRLWSRCQPARLPLTLITVLSLAWGASRWDYRTDWVRNVEQAQRNASLFGPRLEERAQVYWDEQLLPTWLSLGRASYYNPGQQAGQLFNRGTAIEASRRAQRMAPLGLQAAICAMMGRVDQESPCFINDFALREACRPDGLTDPPDYLVLPFRQPQRAIGEWRVEDTIRESSSTNYHLYRCKDIMRAVGTGKAGT